MGVKVTLTRDEIFRAVFDYVNKEYPNLKGKTATIEIQHNKLQGATVDCKHHEDIWGGRHFGTRTTS